MKKVLFSFTLLSLFAFSGCQNYEVSLQGKFYADTMDGIIYLELLSNSNCICYFQGGKEDGGYWHILDNGSISVGVSPETSKVEYWIHGEGTITDANSFSVPAIRYRYYSYWTDKEDKTLYFKRR